MRKVGVGAIFFASAFLGACGGGGSDAERVAGTAADVLPTVLRAEGLYTGTLSNGELMQSLILETGDIFLMHGDFKTLNGQEMLQGPGRADNGSYSSTDTRDYDPDNTRPFFPAPISAAYDSAGRFSGSIVEQGQTIGFSGLRPAQSAYDYDQPASLDKVLGAWGDALLRITIGIAGDIQLSSRQCDGKGTIKPRASGKNVFDIEWTFGAIPACPFYGQTVKSIAFVQAFNQYPTERGQNIIIMGVNDSRTAGKGWYLTR